MKKNKLYDEVYLDHIMDYILVVEDIIKTGKKDRITELATIRAIEVIGEAANNLSESLKTQNREVPWRDIIGMRNSLIHGYFEVDIDEIWDTCENDIPVLKEQIIRIKKELQSSD